MMIKHRDVMVGQSYCSNCKESMDITDLIVLEDDAGKFKGCPYCHEVFEGWSTAL